MRKLSWRRPALTFVLILGLGLLPWPGLQASFSGLHRGILNLWFSGATYGKDVGVEFRPAPEVEANLTTDASWDTVMAITVGGEGAKLWVQASGGKDPMIAVNPRRSAYIPLLLITAILLATPLPLRRRFEALMIGWAALWALSLVWTHVLIIFTLGRLPGNLNALSPWANGVVEVLYKGFVGPPGNRVVEPILVAACIFAIPRYRIVSPPTDDKKKSKGRKKGRSRATSAGAAR